MNGAIWAMLFTLATVGDLCHCLCSCHTVATFLVVLALGVAVAGTFPLHTCVDMLVPLSGVFAVLTHCGCRRSAAYPGCRTAADCQANGDKAAYCRANGYWCVAALHRDACACAVRWKACIDMFWLWSRLQPLRPAVLQRHQRWHVRSCVLPHLRCEVLPDRQAVPGG